MTVAYQFEISVRPEYIEEHSEESDAQYLFAYHINIRNIGNKGARLMQRHWFITDANANVQEVQGDGVLGEQPMIDPGAEHRYSSFCVLETPLGCMQGSYQMLGEDGKRFNADIPIFTLAKLGVLH
ncbi:MAG: Co2+/Mg2+ efflux protein ApaG [Mariprofundaceae bacterium]|nr:Co2+/Mg2+ efflux protein ApaG [Mariprofundaceae bacterium]